MVDGEGLEPRFGGFRIDVAEAVRELFGSSFYFMKDTFDGIPISVGDMLKSESVTVTGRLQPGRAIDQKDRVVDEMFLAEFGEEHLGEGGSSGRVQSDVEQAVGGGIDRRIQPVALVIHLDHGLVNRDVIRILSGSRL